MIKLTNLCFKIKSQTIFNNLNLEISKGEFVGLIGENGSGKTTLLRIILGLISGFKGELKIAPAMRLNYQPESTNKKLKC